MSRRPAGLLRIALIGIGAHSCALGVAMLVASDELAALFGFPASGSAFFPSQSGVFLLALGVCYLLALRDVALVAVVLVSKALAVAFLVTHAFLGAPDAVWAAAAGDAAMLAVTLYALRSQRASSSLSE